MAWLRSGRRLHLAVLALGLAGLLCSASPPRRDGADGETTTPDSAASAATSEDESLLWDDGFDLDGNSWFSQSSSPLDPTWDSNGLTSQREVDDDSDDYDYEEYQENNDVDDDEDSEFLFLGAKDDGKKIKVRHTGGALVHPLPRFLEEDYNDADDDDSEGIENQPPDDEVDLMEGGDVMVEVNHHPSPLPPKEEMSDESDEENMEEDPFGERGMEETDTIYDEHVFVF